MANSIDGRLVSARTRRPLGGLKVEAAVVAPPTVGTRPQVLGSAQANADGAFSIPIEPAVFKRLVESATDVGFRVLDASGQPLPVSGRVLWNGRRADQPIVLVVRDDGSRPEPDPTSLFSVQGVLTNDIGVAVSGMRAEVWDHNVAGPNLIGSSVSGSDGHYIVTFEPGALGQKRAGDIEVRIFDPNQDRGAIAHSDVVFQAPQQLTIDLRLPTRDVTRAPEFDRLNDALQPLLGRTRLADASADAITYLAGRSGWDARAIAMAAQATQLSAGTGIPADHYYALLRSGLPGDGAAIHRLEDAQIEATLELAVKNGVISGSDSINDTVRRHHDEATKVLTTFTPPNAVSSLGTMLALRLDADQQNTFLDVYRSTSQDPQAMWTALEQRGFDAATIANLQTDAVLGDLTLQNAALVGRLTRDAGIERPADLATNGFYNADKWAGVIGADLPAGVSAADYAAGLAAQVAVAYPTLVAADMVRTKQVGVGDDAATNEVATFLSSPGDFVIGKHPLRTWTGFDQLSAPARAGAQLLERLYQLSPSNGSMVALSKIGVGSAMQLMKYSPDGFVTKFGNEFPSQTEAMMVYKKATEVHTTALNIATMYLAYRSAPNVFAITGQLQRVDPQPQPEIAASATLEELFGNMDYCACEHCRSVLSPAAYLVELLEFIDLSDVPHTKSDPLTVLLGRRPDLQHILLTCENTNIALPYIDLVNEVLEYYIVHGSLATFTGYNMRVDSKTADLLADPEFVVDAAYDATKSTVYPFALPFDMPLEHLRLLFEVFDSSLPDALTLFGDPASARRERLRLNAPEYSILTDIGFRQLPEYFGEPAAASIDALNNVVGVAKTFCRRVGIRYTELADVLTSTFVNPGLPVVPLLEPLGVSLGQIQSRFDGTLTDAAFTALLPADLDPTPYGGNVLQWLDTNRDAIMGLIVLTDQSDEAAAQCDFGKVDLRFSLPDMNANRLTPIAYHRLHRFIRLWKKLGWSIEQTDDAFTAFLGVSSATLTTANIDAAFVPFLARLANFLTLMQRASVSKKKMADWLALWSDPQDVTSQQTRLARLLRIGTVDLPHFIEITGLDPFADDMDADEPSMLKFVDRWFGLKSSRLKVTDLDYLLRHDDLTGKLTPRPEDLARDVRTLRGSLTAVDADLDVPPASADLGAVRAKMALVYDASVVDRFFGLVADTIVYSVPLATEEEALPAAITAIDAQLAIDPFQKTLTHLGLLGAAAQTALNTAADALTLADVEQIQVQADLDAFVAAFKTAVQALRDAADADLDSLGADYPELKAVYDALAGTTDPATQATTILGAILPELRAGLKNIALRTTLVAGTKADPLVIDSFTSDPNVLHAVVDNTKTILADFLALETGQAFDANQTYTVLVDPPATDAYVIYVNAPENTSVTLAVDGAPAIPATVLAANGEVHTAIPITFTAGTLARLELTLAGLPGGGAAALSWRTKGIARSPIPATRQYTTTAFDRAQTSLIRLQKAVMLQRALGLTAGEVDYLGAHHPATNGMWNDLDTDGTITDNALHALAEKVGLVVWFAQLKKDHEPDPDTFLHVFEQPDAVNAQGRLVVATVMEWLETDLDAVLTEFGMTKADLAGLAAFRKVSEAMDLVAATLQPAADVIAWSVPNPDSALLTAIRDAVRSRMTDATWLETMQSVSDELRNKRRDALVAYILFHQPPSPEIETPDHLYEYFLIDVQMDACMQTSRIRQALSTVQLFIQRCLMNLELEVSADSIREDQWQWMKRYRVWEANRKVFLYPENWLEPELRDDKSSFFRDLESELLKADITDDAAELAYLNYLKKLDEVARVEVVCSYLQENEAGNQDDDVLHVFGRTLGATREYYYRRFEYGYWTPWEKMPLKIEGEVLVPVVWKSQLFVFWLTHVETSEGDREKTPQNIADAPWGDNVRVTAELTMHWGEYFNGQWTSPKSTEMKQPIRFTGLDSFDQTKVAIAARTFKPSANVSERLVFTLLYLGVPFSAVKVTFTSKNCGPKVEDDMADDDLLYDVDLFNYHLLWELHPGAVFDANSLLDPSSELEVNIAQPANASSDYRSETIFTKTDKLLDGFQVRPVMSPVENQWEAPFFYWDDHSVFFVSGDEAVGSEFTRYYVDDFVPAYVGHVKDIPKLYEEPAIPVKPKPGDPVIDPFRTAVNPNYKVVITDNGTFQFGGQTFDARGAVTTAQFQ